MSDAGYLARTVIIAKFADMKRLRTLLLALLAAMLPLAAWAYATVADRSAWNQAQYTRYLRLASSRLIDMGEDFMYKKEKPDSAMLCYTIVAERYRPGMSESEIAECLEGYYGRWDTRFMLSSDMPAALQDLAAAQEIIERTSLPRAKLDLCLGVAYMSVTLSSGFRAPMWHQALGSLHRSCASALRQRDYRTFHTAFRNLLMVAYGLDSAQVVGPIVRAWHASGEPAGLRRDISQLWCEGALADHEGRPDVALARYDSILRMLPHDYINSRSFTSVLVLKGQVLLAQERYREYEASLDTLERMATRCSMADVRMTAYLLRSEEAERRGDVRMARDYRMRYLELKDSLSSEQQAVDFQDITFSANRRAMQRDIDAARYSSLKRGTLIVGLCVVVVVVIIFSYWLLRVNRRLRHRSESLYRQLQAAAKDSDWIENRDSEKYATSSLDDDKAAALVDRVREYLLGSEDVYRAEFSLATLAQALDTNRQYLSQVVNQGFGCNFTTLVNRVRIRRAMLLLDDEHHYGHYSLEGVAEMVGFGSRRSFSLWFRRFTGLTAAEYRKLGKTLRPKL